MARSAVSVVWLAMFTLAFVGLTGCGGDATPTDDVEPAVDDSTAQGMDETHDPEGHADSGTSSAARTEPTEPPPPSRPASLTVPMGTVMSVEFWRALSSDETAAGERFRATVIEPVMVDEWVAIPVGAVVSGNVVEATSGKKIGGTSSLNVQFTQVKLESGEKFPISASFSEAGKSEKKKDAATIGGAAAGGAVIGRMIGNDDGNEAEGTAVGAVVGAAIGTAIAAKTKGQPVVIAEGMVLDIVLDAPVDITAGG